MHRLTYASNGDSNQPAHSRSLFSLRFPRAEALKPWLSKVVLATKVVSLWKNGDKIYKFVHSPSYTKIWRNRPYFLMSCLQCCYIKAISVDPHQTLRCSLICVFTLVSGQSLRILRVNTSIIQWRSQNGITFYALSRKILKTMHRITSIIGASL